MRYLAFAVATVLSLALVAPAFAQPFADVPTDHWAFDAIAELAAKGLIEGYPDGTFKGDRAMTRYEMAMVVARLLARIEAIKIPEPPKIPPPEVRRADLDAVRTKLATVQRLVNEFRAELAALGVRVTAVEEELQALRARLDNTKVTGDFRFRYNIFPQGSPSGGPTGRAPDVRLRARLTFTGQVTPAVKATVRLWAANNAGAGNFDVRFGNTAVFNSVAFDLAYLDINTAWGIPIAWRVGRQPITLGGTPNWGFGVGLLFDHGNAGWTTGVNDGVTANFNVGPLKLFAFVAQDNQTSTGSGTGSAPLLNYWGVRGTFDIMPGWTLGASYYTERNPLSVAGGALAAAAGVPATSTRGNGFSVDLGGTLISGLNFYGEYASWTFTGVAAASAWRAGVSLNLATLAGVTTFSPVLDIWYKNYGPLPAGGDVPIYTYACDEILFTATDCWNMRGWGTNLSLTFSPTVNAALTYESYTRINTTPQSGVASGASVSNFWARLNWTMAPRTTLSTQWFRQSVAGTDTTNFYRVQLTYSW